MTYPKDGTQEHKVLMTLLSAEGNYVKSTYFLYELRLSQFHRAINNLEKKYGWDGKIEHGEADEFGYRQYRITAQVPLKI